jgi:hypothetical protein
MRSAALLALLLVSVGAGCAARGAAPASAPAAHGVSAYLRALRANDPRSGYAMLSNQVRKELPYAAFAALWQEHAAEREHQAAALEEDLRTGADLGERAVVTFPDGKTLTMQRQSGVWRLDAPLLSRSHAATPHVAVEMFAGALTTRDYDAVMRILTSRRREGISRQVDAFTSSLERHLAESGRRISFIHKDRAELQWTDGGTVYKIVLRLEGDEWRVDDVHSWSAPPPPEAAEEGEEGAEERAKPPAKK